ncbi:hypothetical protein TCAL_17050 [Tigriopus californicus]|uniref:K Homology domain-containing protein n=1 Tax=Tigriopus californicus TaxID=6832 RepID=A0A553PQ23_TIGCA|nr:hypothetical protein TCAL_17050 [Tigriopus californicus]
MAAFTFCLVTAASQMFDRLIWKNDVRAMFVTGERTCWRAWITFTRNASTAFRPISSLDRSKTRNHSPISSDESPVDFSSSLLPPNHIEKVIHVPTRKVGYLIGYQGRTILGFERDTGAKINILAPNSRDSETPVSLTGPADSVRHITFHQDQEDGSGAPINVTGSLRSNIHALDLLRTKISEFETLLQSGAIDLKSVHVHLLQKRKRSEWIRLQNRKCHVGWIVTGSVGGGSILGGWFCVDHFQSSIELVHQEALPLIFVFLCHIIALLFLIDNSISNDLGGRYSRSWRYGVAAFRQMKVAVRGWQKGRVCDKL